LILFNCCCLKRLLNENYQNLTRLLSCYINDKNSADFSGHLINLSEDIHWLLLISGFILFEINSDSNSYQERSTIPEEVMKYSIKSSCHVDFNLVRQMFALLATANTNKSSIIEMKLNGDDNTSCDVITKLFFNVFQLCELESQMYTLNMLSHLSPQVAITLMWFNKELVRSGYLFMNETSYTELSPSLHYIMGVETECATWSLEFILKKLYNNFYIWSGENGVTIQTARVLLEIVKNKEMSKLLLVNDQFWLMSKVVVVNEMPWLFLQSSVKKLIIKSLVVSCGNDNTNSSAMQTHFYNNVLVPLVQRCDALTQIKQNEIHTELCIKEVMNLIETFNGIIEGASKVMIKSLIPFILPRLEQGVHLLNVYHNYGEIVELILEMFNGVIEKFLPFMNDDEGDEVKSSKIQIYHQFLCLIQVFSRHNSGGIFITFFLFNYFFF
jgi:hypothetical protein